MDAPIVIIDCGASGGIHQRWSKLGIEIKSVLFEPDPNAYQELIKDKANNSLIINSALSDEEKEVVLNICKWQQASSIFEPNMDLLHLYQDHERWEIIKKITMQANSLNNLLKEREIKDIDFMKIDTQGSELEILRGGNNFLDSTVGLEVEVEFIEVYKDQPLFTEVHQFLESYGFSLIDMRRTYWKRRIRSEGYRKGQLIFADTLYLKSPEKIVAIENINFGKILRSIYVYLAYGYKDWSLELLELARVKKLITNEIYNETFLLIKRTSSSYHLPNFRGKGKLHNFFYSIAKIFLVSGFSSGTDSKIGN